MAFKNKPIYECDCCKKEMAYPVVETAQVPHEGASTIYYNPKPKDRRLAEVGDGHFCSFNCFVQHLREELGIVDPDRDRR